MCNYLFEIFTTLGINLAPLQTGHGLTPAVEFGFGTVPTP